MAYFEINGLEKHYKDFDFSINLAVEEGELLSIVGPSGSGKSTLLKLLSGIERPDKGTIVLDGKDITNISIQERNIGMVFQDYSLFSNMNTSENIEYGMKEKGRNKRHMLSSTLLELVGLEGYEKRSVSTLSGGEAQRVALARALAAEPKILLLDEPLSALDAPLRKKLRTVIREIHDRLNITMIYVTHDREEAFSISDRLILLDKGKIKAIGTAEELYRKPQNLFTAFFTGDGTALDAHLIYQGGEGKLFFRPEAVTLSDTPLDPEEYPHHIILNGASIDSIDFQGSYYMLGISFYSTLILASTIVKPRKKTVTLMILKDAVLTFNE